MIEVINQPTPGYLQRMLVYGAPPPNERPRRSIGQVKEIEASIPRYTWRILSGFGNAYEINYTGQIRRAGNKVHHIIKPLIKKGIAVVRLSSAPYKRKEYRVHRLVAMTFLPPSQKGQVLYHENGVRTDNYASNLRYIDATELGRKTGKISPDGETVACYSSARAAGRANYMSYQTIIDRCNGKCKSKLAPDGFRYEWDVAG
jgi:hypothetical protein